MTLLMWIPLILLVICAISVMREWRRVTVYCACLMTAFQLFIAAIEFDSALRYALIKLPRAESHLSAETEQAVRAIEKELLQARVAITALAFGFVVLVFRRRRHHVDATQ